VLLALHYCLFTHSPLLSLYLKRKKNKNKNSEVSKRIHPFLKKDLREKIDLIRFDWSNLDHQILHSLVIAMSSTTTARSLPLLAFIFLLLLSPTLASNANHRVNRRFDSSNPICSVLFHFNSGVLLWFAQVSSEFVQVNPPGWSSLVSFLHLLVFLLTRTGPVTRSIRWVGPSLITMIITKEQVGDLR